MCWTKAGVIAVGLGLLGGGLTAAQPLSTSLLRQGLMSRVRLTVVSGRVVNTQNWYFGNSTQTRDNGTTKEEVSFQCTGVTGSLTFKRASSQEEFQLDANSEGRFHFRRQDKVGDKPLTVEFFQVSGEPLRLTVGPDGAGQQIYQAATIWQLLLTQPDECRQYLVPVLETVLSQSQLVRTAATVESDLLKLAGERRADRQQWAAWVQQLGDPLFAKREAADQQLRNAGASLLGYLRQVDFEKLDAEQQSRVRRIIKAMSRQTAEDTPDQVAASLVEEPLVWLALLARSEETTRRTAAQQLVNILGGPIPIDPAADPATQKQAREELRQRIEGNKPKADGGRYKSEPPTSKPERVRVAPPAAIMLPIP